MTARQRRTRERGRRHGRTKVAGRRLLAAGGLTAGATVALAGTAQAAPTTFTVGSLDDTAGATDCSSATNTDCTLRQAIIDANSNEGADTIVFRSGLSGSIDLTSAPEQITEAVSVQGPGADQLTVDGQGSHRIFDAFLGAGEPQPVAISGLTLAHGYGAPYEGGAISSSGADLTISNAVIRDSLADGNGGGVFNEGSLTIENSTLTGNYSPFYGGAVDADNVVIRSSTIDHNNAHYGGGGIYAAELVLSNSTLVDNHANDGAGGAILERGLDDLTVTGSTITGNSAAYSGGAVYVQDVNSALVQNSIVSGNHASPGDSDDLYARFGEFGAAFSLIGVPSTYVNETVPGSNLFGVDPQLGPLQDNGGPTETMAPASSSPVVNKGSAFGLTTDQRGLTRPVEFPGSANSTAPGADGSDIGAVEVQSAAPKPVPGPTGRRAAALSKCKRKHKRALKKKRAHGALTKHAKKKLGKTFKKCKRKARRQPV